MKHVKKFDSFIKESYETDNFIDIKGNDVFVCFRGIKSLVGVPQKVVGDFVCYSNPYLENLKYAPKYVGGKFVCSNNGLTSLEGGPKEVGGDYYDVITRK